MRSFFISLLLLCVAFILLSLDGVLHLHVFFVGLLLALAIFFSSERILFIYLIGGFFQDIRFHFPFGLTFLCIAPFLFVLPFLVKRIHSRMAVLFFYLVGSGFFLEVVEYRQFVQPAQFISTIFFSAVYVVLVYLFAMRIIRDQSFQTKRRTLVFK